MSYVQGGQDSRVIESVMAERDAGDMASPGSTPDMGVESADASLQAEAPSAKSLPPSSSYDLAQSVKEVDDQDDDGLIQHLQSNSVSYDASNDTDWHSGLASSTFRASSQSNSKSKAKSKLSSWNSGLEDGTVASFNQNSKQAEITLAQQQPPIDRQQQPYTSDSHTYTIIDKPTFDASISGPSPSVAMPPRKKVGSSPASPAQLNGKSQTSSNSLSRTSKAASSASKKADSDWPLLGAIMVLAAAVRLYGLDYPSSVVFDEVHFGGFAGKYIHGMFFMDVHPPLAKMLFALFGWLAGYDGEFKFKDIGDDYIEPGVPYVAMRLYPAILGLLTVATAFMTLRAANCSRLSATLAALFVCFENGLLTNARLILLDSALIFFTAGTALFFQKFTRLDEDHTQHLTKSWWQNLFLTGLFLGATASTKWVGLFTIAWVGMITIFQLFTHLGNLKITLPHLGQVFVARAFCLILVPVAFYMNMFAIHFICLVNPGGGEGFMSSEFQTTLNGKQPEHTLAQVSYGSTITLKHHNTQGGYLHSHSAAYPGGSKQQQVTCYPHRDANNDWMAYNETNAYDPVTAIPVGIRNNAVIKLWHPTTQKRLHSHDVRPIVTEVDFQNEVSCYGFDNFDGDANDLFRIEIQPEYTPKGPARDFLTAIDSKFRLIHVMTGCALFSHKVKLPSWGFEQQEVTCNKQGTIPNSIWFVETNTHPMAPADAPTIAYRVPGFFAKFWELQKVMWETNAGLVESHNWDSRPDSWPHLRRGINFWGKDNRHVYLLGNAFIWGLSTVAVMAYLGLKAIGVLRWQRNYQDYRTVEHLWTYDLRTATFFLGWALHYLPFFLMARQLFLHHYFPALYFAILAFGQLFDFFSKRLPKVIRQALVLGLLAVAIANWYYYAPISYGLRWTRDACEKSKWRSTWDFDCGQFPTTLEEYPALDAARVSARLNSTAASAKPVEQLGEPEVLADDTQAAPQEVQEKLHQEAGEAGAYNTEETAERSPSAAIPAGFDPAALGAKGVSILSQHTIYQDENGQPLDPEKVKQMTNVKYVTRYDTYLAGERLPDGKIAGTIAHAPQPNSELGDAEDLPGGADSGRKVPARNEL
ncbi:Dolichyl-phosphate-mannose--protein mannosyltransferase 1 [Savitreella phatthalungensis]